MKKILSILIVALVVLGLCSCDPYADQFNKMQNEINSLKERVERNEESIDILIANTDTEVERLRDYIENVSIISDGQNKEVLEKIESLKTVLDTLKKNTDASDEDRIAEIEALEDELEVLKTRVTSAEERITTLEALVARVTALETEVDELTTAIESLDDKVFGEDGLSELVESYNKALKIDVVGLKLKVAELGETCEDLTTDVKANKTNINLMSGELNNLASDFDDLKARYEIAVEGRVGTKFHINPSTGKLEEHTYKYEVHEDYHLHKCTVCGYCETGSYDASGPHSYTVTKTNLTHKYYCDVCRYSKDGEVPHSFDFESFGTTEEDWYEDYPTSTDYHVRGEIFGAYGSYAGVSFDNLPNLKRDKNISVTCEDCGYTLFKVCNEGDGTGIYSTTYPYMETSEVYVEAEGEYMLRIPSKYGDRLLYLRNYSVNIYNNEGILNCKWEVSGTTLKKWELETNDNGLPEWTFKGECEVSEANNITKRDGWNGTAPWGTLGYVIEGDIYYMQFGNGNAYERVGFFATEEGWVETPYGNDCITYQSLV